MFDDNQDKFLQTIQISKILETHYKENNDKYNQIYNHLTNKIITSDTKVPTVE